MRRMREHAVMLMTVSFLALVLAQAEPSTAIVAGAVALAVGALLAARIVAAPSERELRIGARAREHREVLGALPEPQHPDTDGRPRSRAPARVVPAAVLLVD